tara:strand:+ start:838 stop:1527 length:690 start_codon:yes stop_codon:yes gene_type:complete
MKLLDTAGGNTKIKKSMKDKPKKRIGSLSMYPDDILCPARNIAGCKEMCLVGAGRGAMGNVVQGRMDKTMYYHNDTQGFLEQLRRELFNFNKLCKRTGVEPIARLNTLSDVPWERHGIPQEFPDIFFYDYTKAAYRLTRTPDNYKLMFSYSPKKKFQKQVEEALKTDVPMSAVFKDKPFPKTFLGREVIDGDRDDLLNVEAGPVIVGLKYKVVPGVEEADQNLIVRQAA